MEKNAKTLRFFEKNRCPTLFECKLYDRISKRICKRCNAGYHHNRECAGRKDGRTNVTAATLAEALALEFPKN